MTPYQALWLFFIYAFLGWGVEVAYAMLKSGKIVNRGFLNGPLCPIYGLGFLLIFQVLDPWLDRPLVLFIGAVLLTSSLELLAGWLLYQLFQMRWWDYREEPFNLGGYICLSFSILWGLGCLFVLKFIHPLVEAGIRYLPPRLGQALLLVFSLYLCLDLLATVQTVVKTNRTLRRLDELGQRIRRVSDELSQLVGTSTFKTKENLATARAYSAQEVARSRAKIQAWRQEREELLDQKIFGMERLLGAFPQLHHRRYDSVLQEIREKIRKKRRKS